MAKKTEDKKLTKDQAIKKILLLKKDLFNIRFKKINNQINNPAQYAQIKKVRFPKTQIFALHYLVIKKLISLALFQLLQPHSHLH